MRGRGEGVSWGIHLSFAVVRGGGGRGHEDIEGGAEKKKCRPPPPLAKKKNNYNNNYNSGRDLIREVDPALDVYCRIFKCSYFIFIL